MSSICHGFVQNAWRKDICSNCFRLRDEHSTKESGDLNRYSSSAHYQGNGVNGSSHCGQSETHSDSNNSDIHHTESSNNNTMNNHHISILVKNSSDPSAMMSQKSPSGRYQSPTSGIPRANSHLKYGSTNSKSSYYSTFSADSFKAAKHLNGHMNGNGTANSAEVNGISNKSSSNGMGKKVGPHPLRTDKDGHHMTTNGSSRIVNNSLQGSSAPSSTVVSVNGDGLSGSKSSSSAPSHYNHNHSSNANNAGTVSSDGKRSGALSVGSDASAHANGTIVSVVTNSSKHLPEQSFSHKNGQSGNYSHKTDSKGIPNGEGRKGVRNPAEGVKTLKFDTMDKSAKNGDFPDGDATSHTTMRNKIYKGILKALDGKKRRKLSVKFNKEVCEVIGYSGDSSGEQSEDEEDDVDDPQDLVSITELLASNSTTPAEKELHQQTIKNTNFNSIKTNLLGYAPIEIGPIVGCTGGKSMENSSKPLVSIGTFESRKEPLRIRKINGMDVEVKDEIKEKEVPVLGKVPSKEPKLNGILKKSSINNIANAFVENKDPASSPPSLKQRVTASKGDNLVVNVSVNTANVKVTPAKSVGIGGSEVKINGQDVLRTDGVSTIEVNPERSSIKITTDIPVKSSASTHPTISTVQVDRDLPNPTITSNQEAATDNGQVIKSSGNNDSSSNNSSLNSPSTDNPLNNLIILNGGNIASKRTSFLKEIISNEPVTVVSSNNNSVEEPMSLCADSLDATVLNAHNLKGDLNLKLNHLRSYDILEDNRSEFDDSLEDSGLDIKSKTTVENSSESDDNDIEKFGSSSDSGNENDFHERMEVPKPGLYISVDEEDGKNNENQSKPKLSPDSVLFSSASEMSNSGSAESIPECVNVHVIGAAVKRQAPMPPATAPPTHRLSEVYSNEPAEDPVEEDDPNDIYDDVAAYQAERQLRLEQEAEEQEQEEPEQPEEPEEESLYDDCLAISSNGKSVTGSYDFTNGTRTSLDTDAGADSVDRIPLRPSDGIEFIGIRKIDSETHLNATLESKQRSPSPEDSKKERSSSVSPKARRKVNHFFSTLGKKAGAAFSSSHSHMSGTVGFMRNKSPSPAPIATVTEYKRSLSQDEVSMARTQEIYATLTPASLKFKGLAPVLQKLSRMENETKEDSPKEKMFKKNKIIPSIKKLFRSGGKDRDNSAEFNVRSYDFKTDLKASPSNGDSSSNAASSESSSNPPSLDDSSYDRNRTISSGMTASKYRPAPPTTRPPPPPPRVHSLDLLNRVGTVGPNSTIGSSKPARPPPPVRSNRIAPSFVSVFATQEDGTFNDTGPPSKPKRKASMSNGHNTVSHIRSNDGEFSLDNNVSTLNFETLSLIAGQNPAKIKAKSSHFAKFSNSPIRWSHFYLSDFEPMADGDNFAFYCALWENVPCVLLIQEDANSSAFGNLSCVEVAATFVDTVPIDLVPWNPADYTNGRHEVKVHVSVLPSCTIMKISAYINSRSFSSMQRYFALLQALHYWGKEDMSDLLVFQGGSKDQETPADAELVYVVPVDSHKTLQRSYSQLSNNFEIQIKQHMLQPHVLTGEDRQVLYRLISGTPQEVEFQLKLFLQVKLFASRMKSEEMEKLRRTKSERVVTQWIERERALCMKEAIERTIQRDNEPISPLKKAFVEFLMIPDISAKALLDLIVDLSNY